MKRMFKVLFIVFSFVCFSLLCFSSRIEAKNSTSSAFEVNVGDDKLSLNYNLVTSQDILDGSTVVGTLEDDLISMNTGDSYTVSADEVLDESGNRVGSIQDNTFKVDNGDEYTLSSSEVREKIIISVTLKGLLQEQKSYRWEHTFCYKIEGYDEICETDLTGSDQGGGTQTIYSNKTYDFSFWDGHMPYYSEGLIFEYVKFSNKFVCLEKDCNEEIVLDDIEFSRSNNEIEYYYNYDVIVNYVEADSKEYINASNTSGKLINNAASSLRLVGAPEYKFINEVCVSEDNCNVFETDKVYSGNSQYAITPYIGNIDFSYNNSYFINDENNYDKVTFRTSLQCLNNCASRRIESEKVIVYEKTFDFDYKGPVVDANNTVIPSVSEYVKDVEVKITVNDSGSGVAIDDLIYQIIIPTYGYCDWGGTIKGNYNYASGVSFTIGSELEDGPYCMRYYAYDKAGNSYVSKYYVFYFDNSAPSISVDKGEYNSTSYYNEVEVGVTITDRSEISESYYLWSVNQIAAEDYILVKNNGSAYNEEGKISSLNNVENDGKYFLYMLVVDSLGHKTFKNLGSFNIDVTALSKNDVTVLTTDMDGYSSTGTINLFIEEMSGEEIFKCGLFASDHSVTVDALNLTCVNGENIVLPSNFEGEYSLWVYVHDRANNYSLLEVKDDLLIDTKGPNISYSILKNDDSYHLTNEVTVSVTDLNDINEDTLKYGWFLASKNNVTSNDLVDKFTNEGVIGYPTSYYGEYKLYISALDDLGNEKFICVDKVFKIDTDIIRISLVGEENITLLKGQKYTDAGAKAYKGAVSSGGRVSPINVNGEVDTSKAGVYYITYSSGEGDLLVSVTRKVVVKSDVPYIAIAGALFVLGSVVICIRLFFRKKSFKE